MALLDTLTEQGRIWTARNWQNTVIPAVSSGYKGLDAVLPGGGWPLGSITEVLYPQVGCGELRLLLPALARLSQQDDRWQLWLNPPFQPCAPSLQHWGFNINHLLLAYAKRPADISYSLEKSLQSGGCQAVVSWVDTLDKALMRRIQLAAEKAHVMVFILRPARCQHQPSVAALRLSVTNTNQVHILKRRAGWPLYDLPIALPLNRTSSV